MHDSSEAYPNSFSVPPSPQNPSFIIYYKFLLYVSVKQGGTDSAKPTPDMG